MIALSLGGKKRLKRVKDFRIHSVIFHRCTLGGQMRKAVKYGCFLNIKGGDTPASLI